MTQTPISILMSIPFTPISLATLDPVASMNIPASEPTLTMTTPISLPFSGFALDLFDLGSPMPNKPSGYRIPLDPCFLGAKVIRRMAVMVMVVMANHSLMMEIQGLVVVIKLCKEG